MSADFDWKPEYRGLAKIFCKQHFGGYSNLSTVFPCMRLDYPWAKKRGKIFDSRVPAINNTEYHGLERYATQYHATAQYEFAYHHWLIAATLRREDMQVNDFTDKGHLERIKTCIKHGLYNLALWEWQKAPGTVALPIPSQFELTEEEIDKQTEQAEKEIDLAMNKLRPEGL